MVKRDTIRNLQPGNRLEIQCRGASDLNSSYQTALQIRKELGLSKDVLVVNYDSVEERIVVEYRKPQTEQP